MAEQPGSRLTNKHLKEVLPKLLGGIGALHQDRPDLIIAAWPHLIGDKLAAMTQVISFEKGILFIRVSNSTLYSILAQNERARLLKNLRQRFPSVEIKNIHFRMG